MTPEQFCYWLQGYSEVAGAYPTEEQWRVIQDHLKTVFKKVTPNRDVVPMPMPSLTPQPNTYPPYPLIC